MVRNMERQTVTVEEAAQALGMYLFSGVHHLERVGV